MVNMPGPPGTCLHVLVEMGLDSGHLDCVISISELTYFSETLDFIIPKSAGFLWRLIQAVALGDIFLFLLLSYSSSQLDLRSNLFCTILLKSTPIMSTEALAFSLQGYKRNFSW